MLRQIGADESLARSLAINLARINVPAVPRISSVETDVSGA
jgi:hypothetical protein